MTGIEFVNIRKEDGICVFRKLTIVGHGWCKILSKYVQRQDEEDGEDLEMLFEESSGY